MYPGARQPVRAADAGDQRGVADLGARTCSTPPRSSSRAPSATSRSTPWSPASISRWRWLFRLLFAGLYQLIFAPRDDPRIRPHRRALPGRRHALDAGADGDRLRRRRRWSASSSRCCASPPFAPLRWLGAIYVAGRAGHAAARLAVRLLLRPVDLSASTVSPWIAAAAVLLDLCRRLPRRDLARRLQAIPQHAMGGRRLARPVASPSSCATSSCRRPSRIAIPPTVGFLVQLIKNTSLAAVIGFVELTREGQLTTAATFRPFTVYLIVAAHLLRCSASR